MRQEAGTVVAAGSPVGKPARVGGGIAVGMGVCALLGWYAGFPLLASLGHGFVPMAPSTALELILFGVLVYLAARGPMQPATKRACLGAVLLGTLVALLLGSLSWCRSASRHGEAGHHPGGTSQE